MDGMFNKLTREQLLELNAQLTKQVFDLTGQLELRDDLNGVEPKNQEIIALKFEIAALNQSLDEKDEEIEKLLEEIGIVEDFTEAPCYRASNSAYMFS